MLQSYVDMIKRLAIWKPKEVVLLAVSGGPDSVCLVRLMDRVAREVGFFLHIAHLDHQFRGIASQEDALFVKQLAESLGWPVTIRAIDVPAIIKETGQSMQDCSRAVRYQFLQEVAQAAGMEKIVLGHNKDDQAETILQHLIRGSGMSGMAGMQIISKERDGISLIRPLLDISRSEILVILNAFGQPFRTDASNLGDKYQRNHIRHHLIPFIKEHYNPAIIDRLAETGKILQQENSFLEKQTEQYLQCAVSQEGQRVILDCQLVQKLHPALQSRICREMYRRVVGHTQNLSYKLSKEMCNLICAPHGRALSLPKQVRCEKIYTELHIYPEQEPALDQGKIIRLKINGETKLFAGSIITKVITPQEATLPGQADTILLNLDEVGPDLFIRTRRAGDRFKALGSKGHKKLKDFFIDQKIPYYKRSQIPLLVDKKERILWVIPYRRSEYGKITSQVEQILWCCYTGGTEHA